MADWVAFPFVNLEGKVNKDKEKWNPNGFSELEWKMKVCSQKVLRFSTSMLCLPFSKSCMLSAAMPKLQLSCLSSLNP